MNKKDILIKIHAYVASDGIINTWKSKDMHGNKLRIRNRFKIRFYNSEKTLIKDFINSVQKVYDFPKYIRYSKKRFEVEVRGQIISKKILNLGRVSTKNWNMPENILKRQKIIWIRAFADCDGTVYYHIYNRYVAIDSINYEGLNQISKVLIEFGIINRITKVKYKDYISYRLKISGKDNLIKYNKIIGFNHPKKERKLIEALNSYKSNILKTDFSH